MAGWALGVSIASLLVAIGAVALSWYLWRRSGPDIVVLIRSVDERFGVPPSEGEWRSVEVANSGRMPTVVREVGVVVFVADDSRKGYDDGVYTSQKLDAQKPYPVTIPPTGYLVVPWPVEADRSFPAPMRARGYAISGDGRRFVSRDDFPY